MPQTNADANAENYPSYIGWEVHQTAQIHESCESSNEASEHTPEPADELKDKSKSESIPPIMPSENA